MNGPRKLETAGPIASQLKTLRSVTLSCASRPTWRCRAMMAAPEAPPLSSAARHSTGYMGKITASPAPRLAATTLMASGRLSPWRSA